MMQEERDGTWPQRPWIMAGVGATATLATYLLLKAQGPQSTASPRDDLLAALATASMVAGASFVLTAERRRLAWAALFALGWGLVLGLVAWTTGLSGERGGVMSLPFFSGLLAVIIAAPLFQTLRDEGRRALPYATVRTYAWRDAIVGGASLAFTGLTFLLAFLIASLFRAIGIRLLVDLLDKGWFDALLAGAAFGAARALLAERASLLGGLQRLVMTVLALLAPVFAFATALFLVALPLTGFAGLWKSGLPETPLLLGAAGFAFVFVNAIVDPDPAERNAGRIWRATAMTLLLLILPLALLALVSMGMRVGQYGWTPQRLWGVVAGLIALGFGLANVAALVRGRGDYPTYLHRYQVAMMTGLVGLALFLALPIVDFGGISARSQVARLSRHRVAVDQFDWQAMAFDFGPAGRRALQQLVVSPDKAIRTAAARALQAKSRGVELPPAARPIPEDLDAHVRLVGSDVTMTPALRRAIADTYSCRDDEQCVVLRIGPQRLLLLSAQPGRANHPGRIEFVERDGQVLRPPEVAPAEAVDGGDLANATVEVRPVTRRQLFLNGQPVGEDFE